MKPEQQRIKIAEACGWKPNTPNAKTYLRQWLSGRNMDTNLYVLPDYLNDLNAMAEAEKTLGDKNLYRKSLNLVVLYRKFLYLVVLDDPENIANEPAWATAAQRAEAFLRTLGLWEEES
jgi:hypothetical protein